MSLPAHHRPAVAVPFQPLSHSLTLKSRFNNSFNVTRVYLEIEWNSVKTLDFVGEHSSPDSTPFLQWHDRWFKTFLYHLMGRAPPGGDTEWMRLVMASESISRLINRVNAEEIQTFRKLASELVCFEFSLCFEAYFAAYTTAMDSHDSICRRRTNSKRRS
jgi:hypothetical protein